MNIMQLLALGSGIAVTITGLILSTDKPIMFLDGTSLFIVIGGTLASAAISVQIPRLLKLI